jgi:2-(1,2-epoxy-1,2-dihydrophenyl)acetyl-CoA isomerase
MSEILSETRGAVRVIRLNRPEKYNSFNRTMALALQAALDDAATDPSVRCVYLTGAGKAFCAGQDLAEATDPAGPGIETIVFEHYNPVIRRIREIELPVVCGVNGVAAGAGANMALCCDVVVAAAGASFIQAFSKIGLIPDSGGTWFLPRIAGFQRASAWMMLGDRISAGEAKDAGLVYRVTGDADLQDEALKVAAVLAAMPTRGLALTKKLLNESFAHSLGQQLDREGRLQVEAAETRDYREGVQAFLEKRKPEFKGE